MPTVSQVKQIYEAEYRLRVDDQATAGMQAATAAIEKRNAAIDAGDVVESRAANNGARILKTYDDRGKALAALTRAEKLLADAQAAADADAATGGAKQEAYARAIANISAKAEDARQKLQALDAASEGNAATIAATGSAADTASARLQKMADEADRATKFLNTFNGAGSASLPSGVYEHATSAIATYGNEIDKLRAKYDPLYAAEKRHADELAEIEALTKAQGISSQAAASAIAQSTDTYAKTTKALNDTKEASNGAAYAARNMGIQFVQGISGIATGMPIMQTFIQQGHQVVDTALASGQGIKSMGDAFKGMIAGIGGLPTLIGVGVVGAFAALTIAGNNALGKMAELRAALRGTQENYGALAETVELVGRRVAASSMASTAEATKAAQAFASNKYFAGSAADIERLTRDAADLGQALGGDAVLGAGKLAAGLGDTLKSAEALAPSIRTLDANTLSLIGRYEAAGERSKAFEVYLRAIEAAVKGQAGDVSPLAKAWNELGEVFVSTSNKGHGLSEWFANGLANSIKGFTEFLKTTIEEFQKLMALWDKASNFASEKWEKFKSYVPTSMLPSQEGLNKQYEAATGTDIKAPMERTLTSSATMDAFVKEWMAAAEYAGQKTGNAAQSILGMWGNETGFGKNLYNYNAGNIQAGSNYQGATVVRGDTHADGTPYTTQFRAYNNPMEFAEDFVKLLQNSRYAGALNNNGDTMAFAGGVRRGGYFEDPNGVAKINSAASRLDPYFNIGAGAAPNPVNSGGMVADAKALNDEMRKQLETTRALKELKYEDDLDKIHLAMNLEANSAGTATAKYQGLLEQERQLTADAHNNVDAQTALTKERASALQATAGLTAGEQGLNAALAQGREIQRTTGQPFGPAEQMQATIDYLAKQSQEYARTVDGINRTADASARMTAAYNSGNQAVLDATAYQKALADSVKLFPEGSNEQIAALNTLTEKYAELDRAAATAQVSQQNLTSRNNLEYIQAETASVGMNEGARAKLLATMKAEQEMHAKFGDILPKEAQDYINLAGATSEAQSHLQQMQSSFTDLQNIGVNAFDQVGDAIVEAMVNGNDKAIDFGNVFKGIIASIIKQLAELAIINPIINGVFGTNRSTLGAALDAFGGGGSGLGTAAIGAGAMYLNSGGGGSPYGQYAGTGSMLNTPAMNGSAAGAVGEGMQMANSASSGSFGGAAMGLGSLAFNSTGLSAETAVTNVTNYFGNAAEATNLALDSAGEGVYGVASAGQVGMASFGEAAGVGAETLGVVSSGVSMIGQALPYIGTAVGVISDVAKGNYRGAGLIATGALIGSFIPGIGTALGAAIGGIVDAFLPNHKKNPYQTTGVNVEDGRLVQGESSSQLEDASGAINNVNSFNKAVNQFLDATHLLISNPNGRIGAVGDNVTGFEQVDDAAKLFQTLSFRPDDSFDKNSNYYKALSGALDQTKFMTPEELQDQLAKVAQFSTGLDTFGIRLASTGQRLNDIRIEGVDGLAAGIAALNEQGKPSDAANFRTALQHDLPGQSFANTDAFWAEVNKVNQFVNGTLPSLLKPALDMTSDLQKQIQAMVKTYADAIAQAQAYGLATDDLTIAQGKAVALLQESAIRDLDLSNVGIAKRGAAARGEDTTSYDLQAFDLQAAQQKEALKQQYLNIYGSLIPDAKEYGAAAETLDKTLAAERLKITNGSNGNILASDQALAAARAKLVQQERAAWDANFSVLDKFNSIRARASAAAGDQKDADLLNFDDAAQKEQMDYARQLVDYYGDAFYQSTDYNNRMLELTRVQEAERLNIIKKYGEQGVQATQDNASAMAAAQQKVGTVIDSLKDYANSLRVGDQSPLSARSQYDLAKSQFQAVQGAAAAGDYNSAAKLQQYSQTFLQASRTLNGSGAGYASDYNAVLTALQGVADVGADKLTNSALLQATQTQTAQLSTKFDELKAELVALRREYQQQARAA